MISSISKFMQSGLSIKYLFCFRIIRTLPNLILCTYSKVIKSYFLYYVCFFYTEIHWGVTEFLWVQWTDVSYILRFSVMDFHMFPNWRVFLNVNSQTIVSCLFTLYIFVFLCGAQCKRMTHNLSYPDFGSG